MSNEFDPQWTDIECPMFKPPHYPWVLTEFLPNMESSRPLELKDNFNYGLQCDERLLSSMNFWLIWLAVLLQTRALVSEISHRTGGGFDIQLAGGRNKLSAHFVLLATGSSRQVEIYSLEICYVFVICISCGIVITSSYVICISLSQELCRLHVVLKANKVDTTMNSRLVLQHLLTLHARMSTSL